jgi:hypothetical protein
MPLELPALTSGLQSVFAEPPDDAAGCANGWVSAVESWAGAIIPASTTVSAAVSTLNGALASAFSAPDAASPMESAFAAFAVTVGAGMVGYTPTPPAGQVGFASQFAGAKPTTAADAANQIASLIDTWMKTGLSTLIAPPNTPTPWT